MRKCPCNNFVCAGTIISQILYQCFRRFCTMKRLWMLHWRLRDDNCRHIKSFYRPAVHISRYSIPQHLYVCYVSFDCCLCCLFMVVSTIGAERLHCANAKHQWPPWRKKKKKHTHKLLSSIINMKCNCCLPKMEINFNRFFFIVLFSRACDFSHYSQQTHVSIP